MRVHVGGDHAAFELKEALVEALRADGHQVTDHGPPTYDEADDYPVYVLRAAGAVAGDPGSAGLVLGGSGNGECIAANKVRGVRCALVHDEPTATWAREHNDAQCAALGSRTLDTDVALRLARTFLGTEFGGEDRHARRVAMLLEYEATGEPPPLPA